MNRNRSERIGESEGGKEFFCLHLATGSVPCLSTKDLKKAWGKIKRGESLQSCIKRAFSISPFHFCFDLSLSLFPLFAFLCFLTRFFASRVCVRPKRSVSAPLKKSRGKRRGSHSMRWRFSSPSSLSLRRNAKRFHSQQKPPCVRARSESVGMNLAEHRNRYFA